MIDKKYGFLGELNWLPGGDWFGFFCGKGDAREERLSLIVPDGSMVCRRCCCTVLKYKQC